MLKKALRLKHIGAFEVLKSPLSQVVLDSVFPSHAVTHLMLNTDIFCVILIKLCVFFTV